MTYKQLDDGSEYLRFTLPVNPVPWANPPFSAARGKNGGSYVKPGRNQELHAYEQAIKGEIREHPDCRLLSPPYAIRFWFYRRMTKHEGKTKAKAQSQEADATNMQKATEDALQNLVIDNDVNSRAVQSRLVEQGFDAPGCVVIEVWGSYVEKGPSDEIRAEVDRLRDRTAGIVLDGNEWPPKAPATVQDS